MAPPTGSRPVAALLLASLLPTTGCSWMMVTRAPDPPIPTGEPIQCTSSVAAPVVDTVLAALSAGLGITAIVMSAPSGGSGTPCTGFGCIHLDFSGMRTAGMVGGVALTAAAVPLAISAATGYGATADCRSAKEAQLACLSGVEASCAALRKGPAGAPAAE